MYTFLDKSGRKLCLRPEFTSSIVRAVLNNRASDSVNRVYYVRFLNPYHEYGSAYRYENPQHGRYREFHQFGGEIIRCNPDSDDTEIISLCHSILRRLDLLPQSELLLNSLGNESEMKEYRAALLVAFPSPLSLIHSPTLASTMIHFPSKARRDWIAAACFES